MFWLNGAKNAGREKSVETGKLIILDGAMGTMLQRAGMPVGTSPDVFGADHPDIVEKIHKEYLDAGSELIYANTFSSNCRKLKRAGRDVSEIVTKNIETARRAAGEMAKVALDIGPIGELLEPIGTLSFEEAYECYKEVAVAGEAAKADLAVIETFTDLQDARAALLAVKENTSLPVFVTMSFEADGRTFTGASVSAAALTLTGLGADAIGINCSLGPAEILPLIREMACWTDLPLIVKPNAGLPDPETGKYAMSPGEFQEEMKAFLNLPVTCIGGCCGTDPEFIRMLSGLKGKTGKSEAVERKRGICSASKTVAFGPVHIVGERLNPTGKKRLQQAMLERDEDYICTMALEQAEAGAEVLDVNCGIPEGDECALMEMTVKAVQTVTDVPLQIDSTKPEVLEKGLRYFAGRAIINSVNGTEESLHMVLPLARKYGSCIVALCVDENGIPETAEDRIRIAEKIISRAQDAGIPAEDILVDTVTMTASVKQGQAEMTLRAIEFLRKKYGVHAVLGVSNISFGLPERDRITSVFLAQALHAGLDFPILNPNKRLMTETVAAHRALSGEDRSCEAYVAVCTEAKENPIPENRVRTVFEAVAGGLKKEACRLTEELLSAKNETEVIREDLIPALKEIGDRYEKKQLYLPQLISAADAAGAAFELIRSRIAEKGEKNLSKGKIVLATVHGDIHDIGKNIVHSILENYGYSVIDLGRDVPAETVLAAVKREHPALVGLSALMTTTLPSMEETIRLLRKNGCAVKVMVGGAVLTESYAKKIGADYYAEDAQMSVHIAEEVFGA